jgi:hypothetical protein
MPNDDLSLWQQSIELGTKRLDRLRIEAAQRDPDVVCFRAGDHRFGERQRVPSDTAETAAR